jgi:hypothetical protein
MKRLFATLVFTLSLQGAFASRDVTLSGKDCYVGLDQLVAGRDWIFGTLSWTHRPPAYWKTMAQISSTELEFRDAQKQLVVKASMKSGKFSISIQAGNDSQTFIKPLSESISVSLLKQKKPRHDGDRTESFRVSCSPGLTARVEAGRMNEQQEMDRLGPQAEWHDTSAPSLAKLPLGTIFELTNDLDTDHGTSFIEEHGQDEGRGIELPYRFASAQFHPANNAYLSRTIYPKGSKLKLQSIEVQNYSSGGHGYILRFENLSPDVKDPITWMSLDGRRSGSSDMKIPQMRELLGSHFKIN